MGLDSLLAIVQMPPGFPIETVAVNGARNAGTLADQIFAASDEALMKKVVRFKEELEVKVVKANEALAKYAFKFRAF